MRISGRRLQKSAGHKVESLDSLKKHHPEKLREEAFMTAFRYKYKCFVTGCRMEQ
ncbi:MAG: hypothetical protein HFH95_08540 [Lachnospiraceae bacterium]|nr:hypothetical protein [uncultured Acetatifactor sp.]MCI8543346.1 hypothetical protein [Lachnospiraceae bacterium]